MKTKMFRTRMTKKGQITIPAEYREAMNLETGAVVEIRKESEKLLIRKPRGDIMRLKGSWNDVPKEVFDEMKKSWGRWK